MRSSSASTRAPARHRGAALLTAMVLVTLIMTLAGAMLWKQWRSVAIEQAERDRAQAAWILQGALDWARLILREDSRSSAVDHLGEPWAVPLAESRLSTFLAAQKETTGDTMGDTTDDSTEDGPEAFLSGRIDDAQARFNLMNLADEGRVSSPDVEALERLCRQVNVNPALARQLAQRLGEAWAAESGARSATASTSTQASTEDPRPLLPAGVDQVVWLGVDAQALAALAPFVTLLPVRTPVNANTASKELLAAAIPGLDLTGAERLVQSRERSPFRSTAEIVTALGPGAWTIDASRIAVGSNFFEIGGRLRLGERIVEEWSLVERRAQEVRTVRRRQLSLLSTSETAPQEQSP